MDGSGINVLIDQNHSYAFLANQFPAYLKPHGFQSTIHLATIPPDFGRTYQVFVCFAPWGDTPISEEETEAIELKIVGGGAGSGWTAGPKAIGVAVPPPGEFDAVAEVIGHEFAHNWVRQGPVWVGEALPTWLALRTMEEHLGYRAYSTRKWAERDRLLDELDPQRNKIDVDKFPGDKPGAVWQKAFWIFEQLEKTYGRQLWTRFLTDKRAKVDYYFKHVPNTSDMVSDLSKAAGKDLFPWFNSVGTTCDPALVGFDQKK